MGTSFERWEKDPFFPVAEEVQDSADRMESTYRTWIHAINDTNGDWKLDDLRRDLQTTVGTTKWQLEEFGQAVGTSYMNSELEEDAKDRHGNFIAAIEGQIAKVENALNENAVSSGKPPMPWMKLDEGERNEFALFLSGSPPSENRTSGKNQGKSWGGQNSRETDRQMTNEFSKSSSHLVDLCQVQVDSVEEKSPGHRRTASANADIGSWKIAVADDTGYDMSGGKPYPQPRKIPSFSGILNSVESWSKSNNGYQKFNSDRHQETDDDLPRSHCSSRGVNVCYEKSKSCLRDHDEYDKHQYGWSGAVQRQVQRSHYQMRYSRSAQCVLFLILCLAVLVVLYAI